MANAEHIDVLRRGTTVWNAWRQQHPAIRPDFAFAELAGLKMAFGVNLAGSCFDDANLQHTDFSGANFDNASLLRVNFAHSELRKTSFTSANLRRANLTAASLVRAWLNKTDLREADLTGADLQMNSCSDAKIHGAIFKDVQFENHDIIAAYRHCNPRVLLEMDGWDKVARESLPFFNTYIEDCFSVTDWITKEKEPLDGFRNSVAKLATYHREIMQVLVRLYSRESPALELVVAVTEINRELIAYLAKNPERLKKINDRDFEKLVAELLVGYGWTVELTRPTKDGGYDIFAIANDRSGVKQTWIIECKRWERKVGIEIARQLYTVKQDLRVGGAMLATTSDFTRGVKEFKASRYDFDLRNFDAISSWLRENARKDPGK